MLNKILSIFLMLVIFFSDLIAMDDEPDENVMVLRSGRRVSKTSSVNNCLHLQTYPSQVADFNDQSLEYNDDPIKVFDHYPPVAQGHEEIYDRFLNGKLIYKPNPDSDEGKVELRIADLTDPLEGTFDLSRCGDTGTYLSISTGYRKGKKPENEDKVEIWFAPKFLIEKELNTTAAHFKSIMGKWKQDAPIGMFWTWGGYDDLSWYDYLITENMDNLSKIDLYENYKKSVDVVFGGAWCVGGRWCGRACFMFRL